MIDGFVINACSAVNSIKKRHFQHLPKTISMRKQLVCEVRKKK